MKKETTLYKLLTLFVTFFKVGLFTFGGGYAMLPIIENEVGNKKKWITNIELLDILAISESTPGPIAVNCATYIGYKVAGIIGAIIATLGLALPSFIIIFIISFFYKDFIQITIIQSIFKGLKIGVLLLLISAIIKLSKNIKKNILTIVLFIIGITLSLVFSFVDTGFNFLSLCLIFLGLIVGAVCLRPKGGDEK